MKEKREQSKNPNEQKGESETISYYSHLFSEHDSNTASHKLKTEKTVLYMTSDNSCSPQTALMFLMFQLAVNFTVCFQDDVYFS